MSRRIVVLVAVVAFLLVFVLPLALYVTDLNRQVNRTQSTAIAIA